MRKMQIIDDLGGSAKVGRLCEVSTAAVSQWKKNGIPQARLMFLQLARPDVFAGAKAVDASPSKSKR